jgi:hypothetical protein
MKPIGGIGIEVHETKSGTTIDNILLTDSIEDADTIS